MRRTYQFSKRLRALPKFWRTLKQMDMERTECVPKDDFGLPKFWCLQLKVRDEKNLPVLKTTSGPTKILAYLKLADMERTECVPKDDFGPA